MIQDTSDVITTIKEFLSSNNIPSSNIFSSFKSMDLDATHLTELADYLQEVFPEVNMSYLGIFSMDSISSLAKYVEHELKNKKKDLGYYQGSVDILIEEFSKFNENNTKEVLSITSRNTNYLITGGNSRLAIFLIREILQLDSVGKIYCLVRGKNSEVCLQRIKNTFDIYGFKLSDNNWEKIVALPYVIEDSKFGLSEEIYFELLANINVIYHTACIVNYKKLLFNFRGCIAGLVNLLNFGLISSYSPQINFYSSVMAVTAVSDLTPHKIKAGRLPTKILLKEACSGYGLFKLVCEEICYKFSEKHNLDINIFRIGQVSGDCETGIWNFYELWPLLLRTVIESKFGAKEDLLGPVTFNFIPADTVTKSVHEIARKTVGCNRITTSHIVNKKHSEVVVLTKYLHDMGYDITLTDPMTFADKLITLHRNHKEKSESLDKALKIYNSQSTFLTYSIKNRIISYLDHEETCNRSEVLNNCPEIDDALVRKYVGRWIQDGHLELPKSLV